MTRTEKMWLWWYLGKSSKIKLWSTETIKIKDGYFELKRAIHEIDMSYYRDINSLGAGEAIRIARIKYDELEYKYYGPRYIKA